MQHHHHQQSLTANNNNSSSANNNGNNGGDELKCLFQIQLESLEDFTMDDVAESQQQKQQQQYSIQWKVFRPVSSSSSPFLNANNNNQSSSTSTTATNTNESEQQQQANLKKRKNSINNRSLKNLIRMNQQNDHHHQQQQSTNNSASSSSSTSTQLSIDYQGSTKKVSPTNLTVHNQQQQQQQINDDGDEQEQEQQQQQDNKNSNNNNNSMNEEEWMDLKNDYQFIDQYYRQYMSFPVANNNNNGSQNEEQQQQSNPHGLSIITRELAQQERAIVPFNERIEFLGHLKWNLYALQNIHACPLEDYLLQLELYVHNPSSTDNGQLISTIVTNLIEFTTSFSPNAHIELEKQSPIYHSTPQHAIHQYIQSGASLKRTVLFPVELPVSKTGHLHASETSSGGDAQLVLPPAPQLAKLRVSVDSMWIYDPEQERLKQQALLATRKHLNTYFVIKEDAQVLLPTFLTSASSAQVSTRVVKQKKNDGWRSTIEDSFILSPSTAAALTGVSTPSTNFTIPRATPSTFCDRSTSDFWNGTSVQRVNSTYSIDDVELVRDLNDAFEKSEAERLIQHLVQMKGELSERIDQLKDSLVASESKLEQLYEIVDIIGAEKFGICRQEALEHMVPLLDDHCATDVFKTIAFCDMQDSNQLYDLGLSGNQEDMVTSLEMYYQTIRDCLKQCGGVELTGFRVNKKQAFNRVSLIDQKATEEEYLSETIKGEAISSLNKVTSISDTIICGFETTKQAVRFSLMVHLKLVEVDWPETLLKLDGMSQSHLTPRKTSDGFCDVYLYRGLRCRMAIDTRHSSKTLLATVKRATSLARYAHGGQTLITMDSWSSLQSEKDLQIFSQPEEPRVRTLVQDLGETMIDGFQEPEKVLLIIPEKFKGREFLDVGQRPIHQSNFMNILGYNLEELQEKIVNDVRLKLSQIEESKYHLQGLSKILEGIISSDNSSVTNSFMKEITERQSQLTEQIELVKTDGINSILQKVKIIEKDMLRLSSQFLTVQMQRRHVSPRTVIVPMHDVGSGSNSVLAVADLLDQMKKFNDGLASKTKHNTNT